MEGGFYVKTKVPLKWVIKLSAALSVVLCQPLLLGNWRGVDLQDHADKIGLCMLIILMQMPTHTQICVQIDSKEKGENDAKTN